jgi:lipopolysaccharide biosynthesis glycosyltransferase
MAGKPIQVMCAFDQGYVMPAAAMIRSLRRSMAADDRYVVHIATAGVHAEDRARLDSLSDVQLELRWHVVDSASLDISETARPGDESPLTETALFRLLLDRILPVEVDRVIWLDVDLVVLRSLSELWATPLNAAVVAAAVRDAYISTVSSRMGLPGWVDDQLDGWRPYFNSGVMVVDRSAWRAAEVERRSRDYLHAKAGQLLHFDQDALNAVIGDRCELVHCRWNLQVNQVLPAIRSDDGRIYSFVPREEILEAVERPAIVHWAGEEKPWNAGGTNLPHADRWFEAVDETPWAGHRPGPRPTPTRVGRAVRRLTLAARVLRHGHLG